MAPRDSVTGTPVAVERDERVEARRREGRSRRFALRAALWKATTLKSVRGCARNVAAPDAGGSGAALLQLGADGRAGWSGLTTCSSLWACPCCSERIRSQRSAEIEAAGLEHLRRGGGLHFLTLTMPHDAADPLAETLEVVMGGWSKMRTARWMRAFRDRHGAGFIRAVEVTYTSPLDGGSGWHPHVHVLVFTSAPLSADARADFLGKVEAAWTRHVTGTARKRGGTYRAPAGGGVGVNLRDVTGGYDGASGLLAYLAKVQDNYGGEWFVGAELAKGHHKRGRGRHTASRTPFEILESAVGLAQADDGTPLPMSPVDLQLWHEFEAATLGRKALHWTHGLKADLLPDVPDLEDDQVPDVAAPPLTVAALTADEWRTMCTARNRHLLARLLDVAEREDFALVDLLLDDALERDRPPPPPPPLVTTVGSLDPRMALAAWRT